MPILSENIDAVNREIMLNNAMNMDLHSIWILVLESFSMAQK